MSSPYRNDRSADSSDWVGLGTMPVVWDWQRAAPEVFVRIGEFGLDTLGRREERVKALGLELQSITAYHATLPEPPEETVEE
jgi:hypothetical protein